MIETLAHYIELIAKFVEVIGVLIMLFGLFYAFYRAIRLTGRFTHDAYIEIRQTVGKCSSLPTLWPPSSQSLRCVAFWYWDLLCSFEIF